MKSLWSALLFCCISCMMSSQELTPVFSPVLPVTPTNANGSTRPRIVLVRDSVPLVMWTKTGSGNGIVFTSRWNGSSFDPAVQVSPSGINVYCSADEGGDIAARGDTVYVVFFTTNSVTYCVRSFDAGTTWSDTVRIDHQDMDDAYTPDVQIDKNGNPVVAFEQSDMSMSNTRIMMNRSDDAGQTFSMETDAHLNVPNGIPCECCPPSLLIKDSMAYVMYRNNDNNIRNIVMTISADSGMTFPVVSEVDNTNWVLSACPTAGAEGAFYRDSVLLVWKSANKIWFGCGNAQDGNAGVDQLLEPSLAASVAQKQPSVCTTGDTVIYTWSDRRTNNYDVYISVSGNGPQQISTPFIYNDTIGNSENATQQNPQAVYFGGYVHLVYQDLTPGKVMYRKAEIGGAVGITEQHQKIEPEIYPSPASESFTINHLTGPCTLSVYNMNGQQVLCQMNIISGQRINIENLVKGSYLVTILSEDGIMSTLTLIKQ